jgi:hypothetical protein
MSEGKYRLDVTRIDAQTLGIAAYSRKPKDGDGMWQHLATFRTADEAQAYVNELKRDDLRKAVEAQKASRMASKRTVGIG